MLNKSLVVLTFVCSMVSGARASTLPTGIRGVIIAQPGLLIADSKTYALTHDKFLLSDYLEASRPGDENERSIKQRLEKAQRAWLNGETENARVEFRALTEMSLKADWRESQREALQMAALRLAQSSESGTEREGWLETAARWFGDLNPNSAMFPPPLISEFDAVRRRLETTTVDVDLKDVFADFRYVIIDGRKIEIATQGRVRLTRGLHRLTAYSDSHESVTEFLTAAQLRVLRLNPPELTEGRCDSARLRSRTGLPSSLEIEIYAGAGCSPGLTAALQPSRSKGEITPNFSASSSDQKMESKSRTWLWVAGGVVLAGAAYALTKKSSPEPVHRSGF